MDEYNAKIEKLKELNDKCDDIQREIRKLKIEIKQLKIKKLLKSDLLTKTSWNYDVGLTISSNDDFGSIFNSSYDYIETDEWNLEFDRNNAYLDFSNIENMLKFIKKYDLKVNLNDSISEIVEMIKNSNQ